MKRPILIIFILAFFVPVVAVFAQESSDVATPQSISQRCAVAQRYLNKTLKPRDLRARVDRLQAYRYIFQRLDITAGRMERNNQQGAGDFRDSLNKLKSLTEEFKNNYETYDTTRELATKLKDCSSKPDEFLKNIDSARKQRQAVHQTVADIENLLEQDILVKFESYYQQLLQDEGESEGE